MSLLVNDRQSVLHLWLSHCLHSYLLDQELLKYQMNSQGHLCSSVKAQIRVTNFLITVIPNEVIASIVNI